MDVNDITYGIRGAIFEVNRVLGPGFLEKVYENALLIELRSRGYAAESQVPIKVYYKEDVVGEYIADILVEGTVIANAVFDAVGVRIKELPVTGEKIFLALQGTKDKS